MWVIGGNNGNFLKDVWFSDDGKNWKCIDENPPFAERAAHASAIKDGYLYIFGGYANESGSTASKDIFKLKL